jgi:hypothetical protein
MPQKDLTMTNEEAWDYAIGMVRIAGLEPTPDFLELVEHEKRGEITSEEIKRVLFKKYTIKR